MATIVKLEKRTILWLKIGIAILLAALIILGFRLWFVRTYRIDFQKDVTVTVIGTSGRYSEQEIKDYTLDKWYEHYWILIRWYYKYRKVEPLPYLEKISVNVTDDGKVEIRAYEKMPIGCILEMGNYLYFDNDGIIVSSKKQNVENLPIITGLEYTRVTLYKRFETQKSDLFRVVMNIVQQLKKYGIVADEIHFGTEEQVTLMCGGNRFELGTRETYDVQIQMIRGILDRIGSQETKYHFHMENVESVTDELHATIIE